MRSIRLSLIKNQVGALIYMSFEFPYDFTVTLYYPLLGPPCLLTRAGLFCSWEILGGEFSHCRTLKRELEWT